MDAASQKPAMVYYDPLLYLPRKSLQTYDEHVCIYRPDDPPSGLWLVIEGRVKITRGADPTEQMLTSIVYPDGLFGEGSLLGAEVCEETAVTLEPVLGMTWTWDEIEYRMGKEPRLGLALVQYFARRGAALRQRLAVMSLRSVSERIVFALLEFASEGGTPISGGAIRVSALTQKTIAEYIGTSRELVSAHMNRQELRTPVVYASTE
jgi:CRP/FNR family transcriptional regulator